MVVASVNMDIGKWSAYIDAVPIGKHKKNIQKVVEEGDKLPEKLGRFLFPDLARHFIWED